MVKDVKKPIGRVSHYYDKIGVAIVKFTGKVSVGDTLHFKGNKTDFEEAASSIQIKHNAVSSAKKGDEAGIKVSQPVREGDEVYQK